MLKNKLKAKEREPNKSALVVSELKKKMEDAQAELGLKNSQLEVNNKKLIDYEVAKKSNLEVAEQRGYDQCFDEQTTSVLKIQGRLY